MDNQWVEEFYDMEFWKITGTSLPFVGIETEGEANTFFGVSEKDLGRIHSALNKEKVIDVKTKIYGGKYQSVIEDLTATLKSKKAQKILAHISL